MTMNAMLKNMESLLALQAKTEMMLVEHQAESRTDIVPLALFEKLCERYSEDIAWSAIVFKCKALDVPVDGLSDVEKAQVMFSVAEDFGMEISDYV